MTEEEVEILKNIESKVETIWTFTIAIVIVLWISILIKIIWS